MLHHCFNILQYNIIIMHLYILQIPNGVCVSMYCVCVRWYCVFIHTYVMLGNFFDVQTQKLFDKSLEHIEYVLGKEPSFKDGRSLWHAIHCEQRLYGSVSSFSEQYEEARDGMNRYSATYSDLQKHQVIPSKFKIPGVCVCACVCSVVCVCLCLYVCIYVCMCICMCVLVFTGSVWYTYIHTYIYHVYMHKVKCIGMLQVKTHNCVILC